MAVSLSSASHLDTARDVLRRLVAPVLQRAPLLSVADAMRGQDLVGQHYVGIRAIPIDAIVGSVNRSSDFDRMWRPRHSGEESRLALLRRAFRTRELPPIDVF